MTETMNHLELTAWTTKSGEIFTFTFSLTADQVALMPKSYRVRRGSNSIRLSTTAATGDVNETSIKRMANIIKKVRSAGGEVTANTNVHNGATMDEINKQLGC